MTQNFILHLISWNNCWIIEMFVGVTMCLIYLISELSVCVHRLSSEKYWSNFTIRREIDEIIH